MNRLIPILPCLILVLGGCSTYNDPDFDGIAVWMTPMNYANTLCSGIEFDLYHDCITRVLEHQQELRNADEPEGNATSGTFAMVVDSEIFLGSYASDPFRMYFEADSEDHYCRGSYNAFTGSTDAILKVTCNNGLRGDAAVVRDTSGRSGIGEVRMTNGARGRIAFGPAVGGRTRA